jgi:hypothetical protein
LASVAATCTASSLARSIERRMPAACSRIWRACRSFCAIVARASRLWPRSRRIS